jgi:hypothetical protein
MCIAGQVSFWLYFMTSVAGSLLEKGIHSAYYVFYVFPWNFYVECGGNVFTGILFITLTIASAWAWYRVFNFFNKK